MISQEQLIYILGRNDLIIFNRNRSLIEGLKRYRPYNFIRYMFTSVINLLFLFIAYLHIHLHFWQLQSQLVGEFVLTVRYNPTIVIAGKVFKSQPIHK